MVFHPSPRASTRKRWGVVVVVAKVDIKVDPGPRRVMVFHLDLKPRARDRWKGGLGQEGEL